MTIRPTEWMSQTQYNSLQNLLELLFVTKKILKVNDWLKGNKNVRLRLAALLVASV